MIAPSAAGAFGRLSSKAPDRRSRDRSDSEAERSNRGATDGYLLVEEISPLSAWMTLGAVWMTRIYALHATIYG